MAPDREAQKRPLEEDAEIDYPVPKTIRHDLLDILDASDLDPAMQELESVMRSLEEEIYSSSSPVMVSSQPELGYLLEASDDELGLPPSSAASGKEVGTTEGLQFGGEAVGLGQIWGFEAATDAAEFGFEFDDGGYLELDGLFDYSDMGLGSTEVSWRSESMPAQ